MSDFNEYRKQKFGIRYVERSMCHATKREIESTYHSVTLMIRVGV
jgi:hypothetical protein